MKLLKPVIERTLFVGAILVLTVMVARAGQAQVEIERGIAYPRQVLYEVLGTKSKLKPQVVDLRQLVADDDVGGYEDSHIPGSIPFPGCDPDKTPPQALAQISSARRTIIVTTDGNRAEFDKCAERFGRVQNLAGGMAAWLDANLAEDFGEYVPPSMGAGGGCL